MKCSEDGTTVYSIKLYDIDTGAQNGLIEMRWSNTCQSNWTRTTMYYPNWRSTKIVAQVVCGYESGNPCVSPKTYSNICNPSDGAGFCPITSPNYATWSPMIYSPGPAESCGEVDDSQTPAVEYFGGWANPGYVSGSASCQQGTWHIQLP